MGDIAMRRPNPLPIRAIPIAAAVLLAFASPLHAQPVPPASGQSRADHALQEELRIAVQSLRESERQLGEATPDWERVRSVVSRAQGMLHALPVPAPHHPALERAQGELSKLQIAVEERATDRAQARLRGAADTLAELRPGLDIPALTTREPPRPPQAVEQTAQAPTPPTVPTVPTLGGDNSVGIQAARIAPLIGTAVVGAVGADIGRIDNFLADPSGRVRAAVVEWGGVWGLGERRTVVPIERLQLGPASVAGRARLDVSRDELETMPRYDRDGIEALSRQHGWGEGVRPVR